MNHSYTGGFVYVWLFTKKIKYPWIDAACGIAAESYRSDF